MEETIIDEFCEFIGLFIGYLFGGFIARWVRRIIWRLLVRIVFRVQWNEEFRGGGGGGGEDLRGSGDPITMSSSSPSSEECPPS